MNVAYVNGRYVPLAEASVHIEDRGYQFSDGIYEYFAFYNRTILDEDPHLARLERSLKELAIPMPVTLPALKLIMRELMERNSRDHGGLYLQATRGVARRDHAFPKQPPRSSLVLTVCASKFPKKKEVEEGVKVITHPDLRWQRRDIKSVSLLANVLAKQKAAAAGAREAWLLEGDTVTEGAVSNSYIVNDKGEVITHPADHHILGGITRESLLKLAKKAGIKVIERPYTMTEVKKASEAFLTSTSANVLPVVRVDDMQIGDGKPGKTTRKLQEIYETHILKETGYQWSI
jgi:D-alanine transaminase